MISNNYIRFHLFKFKPILKHKRQGVSTTLTPFFIFSGILVTFFKGDTIEYYCLRVIDSEGVIEEMANNTIGMDSTSLELLVLGMYVVNVYYSPED